jgi:hypothetical protein
MNFATLLLQMCACTTPRSAPPPQSFVCVHVCQPEDKGDAPTMRTALQQERTRIWDAINLLSYKDAWSNLTLIQFTDPMVPGMTIEWDNWEPTPGNIDAVLRSLAQRYKGIEDASDETLSMPDYWQWAEALVLAKLLVRAYDIKGFYGW